MDFNPEPPGLSFPRITNAVTVTLLVLLKNYTTLAHRGRIECIGHGQSCSTGSSVTFCRSPPVVDEKQSPGPNRVILGSIDAQPSPRSFYLTLELGTTLYDPAATNCDLKAPEAEFSAATTSDRNGGAVPSLFAGPLQWLMKSSPRDLTVSYSAQSMHNHPLVHSIALSSLEPPCMTQQLKIAI